MISHEEIIKVIQNNHMRPIWLKDVRESNISILNDNDLEKFIEFARLNMAERIYIKYSYYDSSDYEIYGEYDNLSGRAIEEIKEYNSTVNSIDFTKPSKVVIFTFIDSMLLGIEHVDDWIQSSEVIDPLGKYEEIKLKYEFDYIDEIAQTRRVTKDKFKPEKDRLMNIILNDHEFGYKKNQDSRYWYFQDLMDKPEMEEYRELLIPYGAPFGGNVKMFMDDVWRIFKEQEKKIK